MTLSWCAVRSDPGATPVFPPASTPAKYNLVHIDFVDMAMQTHVLENGQWVRRTVGINEVLARNSAADQDDHPSHTSEPSIEQGLLTQTVVRSPLVRWMLPVKLRGPQYNDVAFVGVSLLSRGQPQLR